MSLRSSLSCGPSVDPADRDKDGSISSARFDEALK